MLGRNSGIQRDPRRRPGWLLEARSNPRPRGMAVAEGQPPDRTRLTGRLAFMFRTLFNGREFWHGWA